MQTPIKKRESRLELYRIIFMLLIIAHHYVVNSGVVQELARGSEMGFNDAFLWLLGGWGKIGINCFVLITGYFMCTSQITLRKFLKLICWWQFYAVGIYAIFLLTGYEPFSLKSMMKTLIPFRSISYGFVSSFLIFFLFIPFLNLFIERMGQRMHTWLLVLLLGVFSVWPTLPFVQVTIAYVGWFIVLYFVAAYLRLYSLPKFVSRYLLKTGGGGIFGGSLFAQHPFNRTFFSL